MRTFPDEDIRKLRRTGDLIEKDGKRFKSVKKELPAKVSLTSEERQTQALEAIVAEIKKLLKVNSQHAVILLNMIKKLRTDVQLEVPKPIQEWDCTPYRGGNGKIERIRIQAVK